MGYDSDCVIIEQEERISLALEVLSVPIGIHNSKLLDMRGQRKQNWAWLLSWVHFTLRILCCSQESHDGWPFSYS